MGMESGPRFEDFEEPGEESPPQIKLPYSDEALEAAFLDPDGGNSVLYAESPILWMRTAIGLETGRGASCVSNLELAEMHSAGGFAEWDPHVAHAVAKYLHSMGFIGLYGLQDE